MTAVGRPKALVLFNAPVLPPEHPDSASESDVVDVARAVALALRSGGFDTELLAASPPLAMLVAELDRRAPDVVFNLIEGFGGRSAGATYMSGLLELGGWPYTGSTTEALAACASKARTKMLLRGAGLPTAPFERVPEGGEVSRWGWEGPAIVKPDAEDGSLGIDQGSVVLDAAAASIRAAMLHNRYGGDVLVEAYLPGPEYNVGVLEHTAPIPLPVAEVAFARGAAGWPILTYGAKWSAGSDEDLASPVRCPADVTAGLSARLQELAVLAFRATGCRDYARVDLRLDAAGEPRILEVNPNPDIGPTAGWARALQCSGRPYAATIAALARQALGRCSTAPA